MSHQDPYVVGKDQLSEIGEPIQENIHEHNTDTYDKKNKNKTPSKPTSNAVDRGTHYESIKHPNMEFSEGSDQS